MERFWIAGMRAGKLYTVEKRPLDPRWSPGQVQRLLAWCATGQHLGLDENRAFQAAEALIMKSLNHGITWSESSLTDDMALLETRYREETT
jgi:hypothetical protein